MKKIVIAITLLSSFAHSGYAQSPLEAAIKAEHKGPSYTYELEFSSNDMTIEAFIDASKPVGSRLRLSTSTGEVGSEEFRDKLAELDRDAEKLLWCSQFLKKIPANAELVSKDDQQAVYQFQPVSGPNDSKEERNINKSVMGRAIFGVKKPGLLSYREISNTPFRLNMMAEITAFDLFVTCDYAPDGRTFLSQMRTELKGSVMFQEFEQSDYVKIYGLKK